MANKKITELPELLIATENDVLPIVDEAGPETKKIKVSGLKSSLNLTRSDVGLSSVDNTSDANKPISTATQTALNLKADEADLQTHVTDLSNPHQVTKEQIGLSEVDNTSDIAKPISTATQDALNLKANSDDVYTKIEIDKRSEIPKQVVDLTRCVAPFPLLSNGGSPGGVTTLIERHLLLFPIFIPTTVNITHFGIRSSNTGSPSFDAEYGFYTHDGGLPTTRIANQVFTIPVLGALEFNEQEFTTPVTLERGVYWISILNRSAVTASLASTNTPSDLLNNLIGISEDIGTNANPRCFTSVVPLAENFLPAALNSRSIDMRVTTASQTTLRIKTTVALACLRYTV